MKILKINSLKVLINMVFVALFLQACSQNSSDKKHDAGIDAPEMNINTAVLTGNLEVVKQHIEAGTDINMKDQMSGSTPLITAVTFDKTDIAKALIDANADLTIKNNDGATALHVAAFFCRIEIAQMLIDANADKTSKNNFGATPRETVMGPFADMKPVYEMIQLQLEPLGLKLDLKELEKTRPVIAMMLQ